MRSTITCFFAIGFLFSVPSFGQNDRGSVSGVVQDPWGAAMPVATVEAKNVTTGSISKAPSNAAGKYTLADLPPGTYDISVTVPAVRPFEKKGVAVAAGKTVDLNIKLQEGTQ